MSETHDAASRLISHHGLSMPSFFYGTAWKEDQTASLTEMALNAGFRAIDTANQRRHYHELGVGQGLQRFLARSPVQRSDLFLQSKFTYAAGQDHRLPYDPVADYATQVQQSFASSLEHLQTDYLDAYLLHGPASGQGLLAADWEVWRAMEALQKVSAVRLIGVSNVNAGQLQALLEQAEVKPAFVQNRCYARTGWDAQVRSLCQAHGIRYQGFSLLTANARELQQPACLQMAQRKGCSVAQLVFRFALQVGMIPLTGTSQQAHMQADLAVYDQQALNPEELALLLGLSEPG